MRINWFSNAPWVTTGYGVQTNLFVPRIQTAGHEVSVTAFYGLQGGRILGGTTPMYPNGRDAYGQDVINAHARHAGAQAIITLIDAWVVNWRSLTIPWFPWYPVDHRPMPRPVRDAVANATKGITMSKFGQRMAQQEGFDHWYVPHGVDTKVFRPGDMAEARKKLGLPRDAFIVGMVAANKGIPPRKSFFEHITAFAALKQRHNDALLYLHTDDGTHGGEVVNLPEYIQRIGLRLGQDVLFCDQYLNNCIGFPPEYMVDIYNAMDVMMLASRGEGFGVPLIEAQACGVPVITGDWTAMGELCFSGWKITEAEAHPFYQPGFSAFQNMVHPGALAERLLMAYEMRGNQDYRKRARDGALAYDADKVFEKYWTPVLAEMEEIIKGREEQPYKITKVEL